MAGEAGEMNSPSNDNLNPSSPGEASPAGLTFPETLDNNQRDILEASCSIREIRPLEETLHKRVKGQDEIIDAIVCSFSRLLSGLHDRSRPLLTGLLLGPTGVGKTETARALAQTLFGSSRAMTRINCEEYAHGHEVAKLLGSPPGYVGHDIEPLLSQKSIDMHHRLLRQKVLAQPRELTGFADRIFSAGRDGFVSVILFDEIEKAHPSLWSALLGVLEDGVLTLGNNTTTDFTRSVILMTSNVGSKEMSEVLDTSPIGFRQDQAGEDSQREDLQSLAMREARRVFPFEFLNRFDEILVYSPLEPAHLEAIFEKFLADIHERSLREAGVPLLIKFSRAARESIIERGTDIRFGARPLRRVIERELVDPLSRFIASRRLSPGDVVEVDLEGDALVFYRRSRYEEGIVV